MKKTIIVDVDNTLVNSSETILDIYKDEMSVSDDIKYTKNHLWDFEGLIPRSYLERALELFGEDKFYDKLKFIPYADKVMNRLNSKYNVKICSVHDEKTADKKINWLKNNLPFLNDENIIILPYSKGFNKSKVTGDIIIDDKMDCLFGNREMKLLFGEYGYNQYENLSKENKLLYNTSNNIIRVENWKVIESLLI